MSFGNQRVRVTKGCNGDSGMEARGGAGQVREKTVVSCMVH